MPCPIRLNRADADDVHPVVVGTTIEIALAEIPTTGFRWSLSIEPTTAAVAMSRFLPGGSIGSGGMGRGAEPARPALGAGGERVFILSFAEAGSVSVALTLRREWEPLDQAADAVAFTFAVT